MRGLMRLTAPYLALAAMSPYALAAPRDVQIRSVDFTTNVVELHNFGAGTEPLDGWRFCTQDEDQILVYSLATGLNGRSLAPGGSLFIHMNNDAPLSPDAINASTVGAFAGPVDAGPGAYAMSLFFPPVVFSNPGAMADHIMWSVGGLDNTVADERADEARNGGLWVNDARWIATTNFSLRIDLLDTTGGVLHEPNDYFVTEPTVDPNDPNDPNCPLPGCSADLDGDCAVGLPDLAGLLAAFGQTLGDPGYDPRADLDNSAAIDLADLAGLLAQFGDDCN